MNLSSRAPVVDVNGMLHQASTPLSVHQLLMNGVQRLRVLSSEKMAELINCSVRTIIDKYRFLSVSGNVPSAQQIEKESKAEFRELVDQYHQAAEAAAAVERSKQALAQEFEAARFELEPADEVAGKAEEPPVPAEESRETRMLKRRIEKLSEHVANMEAALKTLSSQKVFSNQHVQNILRDLGLAQDDKYFEKKQEMLRVVLNENQEIRRKARELAACGISLASPGGPSGPAGIVPPTPVACTRRSA